MANSFSEPKTFEEFLEENTTKRVSGQTKSGKPKEDEMTDKEVAFQIVQSEKILKGFTPPTKGG